MTLGVSAHVKPGDKRPKDFELPTVFQAAGPDQASIQGIVDQFRAALGDNNLNVARPARQRPAGNQLGRWRIDGDVARADAIHRLPRDARRALHDAGHGLRAGAGRGARGDVRQSRLRDVVPRVQPGPSVQRGQQQRDEGRVLRSRRRRHPGASRTGSAPCSRTSISPTADRAALAPGSRARSSSTSTPTASSSTRAPWRRRPATRACRSSARSSPTPGSRRW